MKTQGNGRPTSYTVHLSGQGKAVLKEQHQKAAEAGRGESFLKALRQIGERLHRDPLELGEPLYRLPALKCIVCQVIVLPATVVYGVYEERPLVFIRAIKFIS